MREMLDPNQPQAQNDSERVLQANQPSFASELAS